MKMRQSTVYACWTAIGMMLLIFLICIHPRHGRRENDRAKCLQKAIAAELGITDLCLFSEAPYTRHPALADRHGAFQPHPVSLEHFPSGAVFPPPPRLSKTSHAMD